MSFVPADGVLDDGVLDDGVPADGVPADGVPADGVLAVFSIPAGLQGAAEVRRDL